MKSIKIISLIVFFLSIIATSLRRVVKNNSKNKLKNKSKAKTKTGGPYDGSELDIKTKELARTMCLKIGKIATYNFFKNIDAYLQGKLPDHAHYDKIFGRTFVEGRRDNSIDMSKIAKQMFTTMEVAIGGRQDTLPEAYWTRYSEAMQEHNAQYLNGLVKAASAKSAVYKAVKKGKDIKGEIEDKKQALELAKDVLQDGGDAFHEYISENSGLPGAQAGMRWINQMAVTITQTYIMHNANSAIFNNEGIRRAETGFKGQLLKRNGHCGESNQETEDDATYARAPHEHFNMAAIENLPNL